MQKSWPNNDLSYDELAFCIIELILRDFEVQLIETYVRNYSERRQNTNVQVQVLCECGQLRSTCLVSERRIGKLRLTDIVVRTMARAEPIQLLRIVLSVFFATSLPSSEVT